jgi:transposase
MRQETFTLSQKELQRVSVISACIKGDMACARAAELLCLSARQVKRLKKRMREDGEAALAHANRGRPSHRRLPDAIRQRIVQLARTTYAGFNDHHLCEKLVEREGFSLSRESLRRLLRNHGQGSPRQRRAPVHRQRRVRSARLGELVQLDGSPHDWLEGRGPQLTALGMQDDATGKILAAQFFPSETTFGYLCLLRQVLRRFGVPLAFYGDRSGIFVRNDDTWTVEEQLAGKRQPTQFGRALEQLGVTFIAANSPQAKGRVERLWGVLQDRLCSELRLAGAHDLESANAVLRKFIADYNRRFARQPRERELLGGGLQKVSSASAASYMNAPSATTTSCSGKAAASRSPNKPAASASPVPRCRSTKLSMGASRSTTATRASNTPPCQGGDTFMLPLG